MHVGGDVKAPIPTQRRPADYEHRTRSRLLRVSRNPVAEAIIEEDGSVSDVRIVSSSDACIDAAFANALKDWRFKPATYHGHPVRVVFNFTLTVHFN